MISPALPITRYPAIYLVLKQLLRELESVLLADFVALYLYGSLAAGDFDPDRSDVDFVVVTEGELASDQVAALRQLHERLAASDMPWTNRLEGSYLSRAAMQRYDPDDQTPRPTVNEGSFYLAPHGYDWIIQRSVLRECGVVIGGPRPESLIDPVAPEDVRHAIAELLHEWWAPMIEEPERLRDSGYQAYAILTMCRALYGLRYGRVVSKPVAGAWAQLALEERWHLVIRQAFDWKAGQTIECLSETIELIHLAVGSARLWR